MATAVRSFSMQSHTDLMSLIRSIFDNRPTWYYDKLRVADMLYHNVPQKQPECRRLMQERGVAPELIVQAPVIRSQIGTAAAVLVDTFLSGYPIFGVVATKDAYQQAEQMEALLAQYAIQGNWFSHLYRFLHSLAKYGHHPFFVVNQTSYDFSKELEGARAATPSVYRSPQIVVPDAYNTVFDWRVLPERLHVDGEFYGYSEIMTKVAFKALVEALRLDTTEGASLELINLDKVEGTTIPWEYYNARPPLQGGLFYDNGKDINPWYTWFKHPSQTQSKVVAALGYGHDSSYLVSHIYLRISPEDYGLHKYGGKAPMVFYCIVVNMQQIIHFRPVHLQGNSFPGGMGTFYGDDYGYHQTSPVQNFEPYQTAASTMLSAAVHGANRATSDRALFDPAYLRAEDLKKSGSVHIPLNKTLLAGQANWDSIYRSIPFDASAVYALPRMIQELLAVTEQLEGRNAFAQGLPQRGNRTLGEFATVMQNSDLRTQQPSMLVEASAFGVMKELLKQWIRLNAQPGSALNQRTQRQVEITEETLRTMQWDFSMATGYFSKSMVASTDALTQLVQVLLQVPQLQAEFDLSGLLLYLMSINGAKQADQFKRNPEEVAQATQATQAAQAAQPVGQPE